jgi:hypothetical protein
LQFIQTECLFRDTEQIGDDSDGEKGSGFPVHFHQCLRHAVRFGGLLHLKVTLYFRC